jgi:hypothetical protein
MRASIQLYSRPRPLFVSLLAASVAAGCAESSADADADAGMSAPVYAMVTHVWSDEGPTGYVALMSSLDVTDVSLDSAREFSGYTSAGVASGQLLVSPSAEDITIERYRITDSLDWQEAGKLGFAQEGVEEVGFYRQFLSRDRQAYVDVDVTGRVIWDPARFEVHGLGPDTDLPLQQDGLDLFANFNRTNFVFDDEILRPFSYHDQDWFRWSADTRVVIYDPNTHEPRELLSAQCPGLDTITRDEEGNTYLGTWEYSALHPLMGTGAAPCVVRLTPQNALDEAWNPDLTELTAGRHVVNFRYVGEGKAIAAVLHAEEYGEGFDFKGLTNQADDFWAVAARFHRLWLFDLAARLAAPMEGIEDFDFVNPGFFHALIDGRVFLFLGDGSTNNNSKTVVYELERSGRATRRFEAPGAAIQWLKLR